MDTTKWKSVLLPRDVYEELVVIARVEGRTLVDSFGIYMKAGNKNIFPTVIKSILPNKWIHLRRRTA